MVTMFDDLIHKSVEFYIDDIIYKSIKKENHLKYLRFIFKRMRQFNLKLNPKKYIFWVYSVKFLSYIVSRRGIKIDPKKVKSIMDMTPTRNIR